MATYKIELYDAHPAMTGSCSISDCEIEADSAEDADSEARDAAEIEMAGGYPSDGGLWYYVRDVDDQIVADGYVAHDAI